MPTGTGKTETMLAWLVAQRPERVLVVVPSTALRDQIATKFETLGILQLEGIVDRSALRPRVGRLEGRFADDAEALEAAQTGTGDGSHAVLVLGYDTVWGFGGRPTWITTARSYDLVDGGSRSLVEMIAQRREDIRKDQPVREKQ